MKNIFALTVVATCFLTACGQSDLPNTPTVADDVKLR
jgi:major membrane immunogen (membrane-anchored lipoprotein)